MTSVAYVTGAAGFVASHLCDRLLADGWIVVGVDNLSTGDVRNFGRAKEHAAFRFVSADVAEPWTWRDALDEPLRRPSLILHLASPASPLHYERLALETLAVNAGGTMHAVALAGAYAARLVFASTSETYGDALEHPQRETYWGNVNPVGIRACYDEGKRFGEAYVSTAARKLQLDARIVRIFNTYGPRMQPGDGRLIPNFCLAALRGEPLTVYGDGSQTRSLCYVDDLVEGFVRAAMRPGLAGAVVNLGNPDEHSVLDIARTVARVAGVELAVVNRPLPTDDPVRRRPDIARARALLDWEPRIDLETGVRRTLASFASAAR